MLIEIQQHEQEMLNNKIGIPILDYVPEGIEEAICVIGESEVSDFSSKTFDGYEVLSTIYVYDTLQSMPLIKTVLSKIQDILKNSSTVRGNYYIEYYKTQKISVKRNDMNLIEGFIQIKYRMEEK